MESHYVETQKHTILCKLNSKIRAGSLLPIRIERIGVHPPISSSQIPESVLGKVALSTASKSGSRTIRYETMPLSSVDDSYEKYMNRLHQRINVIQTPKQQRPLYQPPQQESRQQEKGYSAIAENRARVFVYPNHTEYNQSKVAPHQAPSLVQYEYGPPAVTRVNSRHTSGNRAHEQRAKSISSRSVALPPLQPRTPQRVPHLIAGVAAEERMGILGETKRHPTIESTTHQHRGYVPSSHSTAYEQPVRPLKSRYAVQMHSASHLPTPPLTAAASCNSRSAPLSRIPMQSTTKAYIHPKKPEIEIDRVTDTRPSQSDLPIKPPSNQVVEDPIREYATVGPTATCVYCTRQFAENRIEKHSAACQKLVQGKARRKVFDPSVMRTKGTDNEAFQKQKSREKNRSTLANGSSVLDSKTEGTKSSWRDKHELFRQTLYEARKVSQFLAKGGKACDLPPAPPAVNTGKPCPSCGRKFAEGSWERHTGICANLRHGPPKRR
ncbi:hypothetical protein BASA83_003532 [Batrachochytrium salamandrivorans]|nr:hypothetical protein BASA83_003532 [Batrachochytrium salamandrivorans]